MLADESHDHVVIALAVETNLIETFRDFIVDRDQPAAVCLPLAGLVSGIDGGLGEGPVGGLADVEPFHRPASSGRRWFDVSGAISLSPAIL